MLTPRLDVSSPPATTPAFVEKRHRPVLRSTARCHDGERALRRPRSEIPVAEEARQRGGELRGGPHPERGARQNEGVRAVAAALDVRPDDDRDAEGGRLERVVPAVRGEGPAHERDGADPVGAPELPRGIEDDRARGRPRGGARPPRDRQARAPEPPLDGVDARQVPRGHEEPRVRVVPRDGGRRLGDRALLAGPHAPEDDDGGAPGEPQRAPEFLPFRVGEGRRGDLELGVSGHRDDVGSHADRREGRGVALGLTRREGDLGRGASHGRPPAAVAPGAPRREPPVHDAHGDTAEGRLGDEVRPELRLHEKERAGAHGVERSPDGPDEVERRERHGDARAGHPRGRPVTRGRDDREKHLDPSLPEGGDDRGGRRDLTDRGGMHPDAPGPQPRQLSQTLPPLLPPRAQDAKETAFPGRRPRARRGGRCGRPPRTTRTRGAA